VKLGANCYFIFFSDKLNAVTLFHLGLKIEESEMLWRDFSLISLISLVFRVHLWVV